VVSARKRTEELHPNTNTWGAYQCYGNPDFRLIQAAPDDDSGAGSTRRYVARLEILQRLQDIAAMANEMPKEKVRAELGRLREDTPVSWRDGEVLAAFGKAYAAIGDYDQAIASYRQALADESEAARLKLVQDMANLMERHARTLEKQEEAEQRSGLIQSAIKLLRDFGLVVTTGEQAAVLGGFYKRQGEDAEGDERKKAWEDSLACYQEAFDKRKQIGHEDLLYPGLNAVALAYVLEKPDREKWKAVLKDSAASAAERRQANPDFWSRAAVPDALLLECLWDGTLANKEGDLIAAYDCVIEGGGRATEFDSMVKQLHFLKNAVPPDLQPPLKRIWEAVSSRIPR
jgi:tetratricopeptide (TPR) repeat protein